jgi:hypothetical protein
MQIIIILMIIAAMEKQFPMISGVFISSPSITGEFRK